MTGFSEGNSVNETATTQLKSEDIYLIFGVHNRYIVCKYRTRVVYVRQSCAEIEEYFIAYFDSIVVRISVNFLLMARLTCTLQTHWTLMIE